jgi:hexosaminidase
MKNLILLFLLTAILGRVSAQYGGVKDLMPVPVQVGVAGQLLAINPGFRIAIQGHPDARLYAEASRWLRRLGEQTGVFLDGQGFVGPQDTAAEASLLIRVNRPGKLVAGEDESYEIESGRGQVYLRAECDLGAIRGLETLLQLVTADSSGFFLPPVRIIDRPRFVWRGLLLDVALHFLPVDVIKRNLDGMAAVKMNVLHLHLCNDQGFRVESKVFPRLQGVASDGNYYTQEEIREIVRYAGQRGIRVVPEFVVPAHCTAMLTAYPELAAVKRKYRLEKYFGVHDPVMDPTNEKVYDFLDRLFTEMAGLFPDRYFHIGGDENTGKDWESNPRIIAFMKARGMKHYMDLQTWFNRRLLPILQKNHKTMVGWDEVLQPGIPKEVTIQSWRGQEAWYESLRRGHQGILSYGYYIDLIQPAAYHYSIDPDPDSARLGAAEKKNILGGEATMWGEMVTARTVDSRIWPRTAAIAERLWSPARVKDTDDLYRRLDRESRLLEGLGLQHEAYKLALYRQLANSADTRALEVLVSVLEPLKIYDRNPGDTMYTVFSPFTKLADIATPDAPTARNFRRAVNEFLANPAERRDLPAGSQGRKSLLMDSLEAQLRLWKDNDAAFRCMLAHAPALQEGARLSANLSSLAAGGLEALTFLRSHAAPPAGWFERQEKVVAQAREQGGRCELQVVDAVEQLLSKANSLKI